jgi:hypothetical protein
MSGLVVQDYQWEFDGLLLGLGTPYAVKKNTGFKDLAGVHGGGTLRSRQHGTYVEPNYSNGLVYDLEFEISSTPSVSFTAAVQALEIGTGVQDSPRPLWFQLPGQTLRVAQVMCTARGIPVGTSFPFGLAEGCKMQFFAPDPMKYGATQNQSTGLPTSSGGLTYPLVYPLNYGSTGASGRVTVSNPGSAPMSPQFTVVGPIDSLGFQVTCIEDALTSQYVGSVGALDQFYIDTRTGITTLNGSPRLVSFTSWPVIPPGATRTFAFGVPGVPNLAASLMVTSTPGYW